MLSWTAHTSLCSITFGTETRCKMINVKERCLVKEDNGGVSRGWPLERLTRLWKHSLGLLTTLSDHPALLPLSDPPPESPHRLVAPRAIWRAGLFTTFSRLGFLHCSREVAMFARSQRESERFWKDTWPQSTRESFEESSTVVPPWWGVLCQ